MIDGRHCAKRTREQLQALSARLGRTPSHRVKMQVGIGQRQSFECAHEIFLAQGGPASTCQAGLAQHRHETIQSIALRYFAYGYRSIYMRRRKIANAADLARMGTPPFVCRKASLDNAPARQGAPPRMAVTDLFGALCLEDMPD
eukprot:6189128-Pyramimonas_sp.AAC.1